MIALFTKNNKFDFNSTLTIDSNSPEPLKYIQINLQHRRLASLSLAQIILDFNIDLVFIQEPYTYNNDGIAIPNVPSGY